MAHFSKKCRSTLVKRHRKGKEYIRDKVGGGWGGEELKLALGEYNKRNKLIILCRNYMTEKNKEKIINSNITELI